MRNRVPPVLAAIVAVTGTLGAAGCTERSCSAVLFSDQVVVHVARPATMGQPTDLRVCVDTVCQEQSVDRSLIDQVIPMAVGKGRRTVVVTGRDRDGRQLFTGSTEVTTVAHQPAGSGCMTIQLAKVTVTDSGIVPTN